MDNMTGFSSTEYTNKQFIDFVAPGYRTNVMDLYIRRSAGEAVPNRYEIELLTQNSYPLPIEMNASIIQYEGKPATMAIIRDIT
jgi:PAS domain S-box-containing protein